MPIIQSRLINHRQFMKFCRGQVVTGDHYPHVMLFSDLATTHGMPPDRRAWLTLLYMAYYDDGSAWVAYSRSATPSMRAIDLRLKVSKQRRNLYGGRIARHIQGLVEAITNSPSGRCTGPGGWLDVASWGELLERLGGVYGNGRWASYTTAEMLVALRAVDVTPDTFEIAGSSGPRLGLEYLGLPPTESSARALRTTVNHSLEADIPPQVVESVLCNWSRMCKGGFYLGHNFDRQQGRIIAAERLIGYQLGELWAARSRVFQPEVLGELNGWTGVDKPRLKAYADTGVVLTPSQGRA